MLTVVSHLSCGRGCHVTSAGSQLAAVLRCQAARLPGCHSPDLAALDALAAGWQVVHRVDGADGPGVAPPLVLAAFAVAPHGLVHLRTRKHADTHEDAEEEKTDEITGRMQSSVAQREKKKNGHA